MDKDMPADWAIERALAESGNPFLDNFADLKANAAEGVDMVHLAFARYIEAHEQLPVDPDLETAREIVARAIYGVGGTITAEAYRYGDCDHENVLQFALAKLKEARGK